MKREITVGVKLSTVTKVESTVMHLPNWLDEYMQHRNKITAIKAVREAYPGAFFDGVRSTMSLSFAKGIVESFGFETDTSYEVTK